MKSNPDGDCLMTARLESYRLKAPVERVDSGMKCMRLVGGSAALRGSAGPPLARGTLEAK